MCLRLCVPSLDARDVSLGVSESLARQPTMTKEGTLARLDTMRMRYVKSKKVIVTGRLNALETELHSKMTHMRRMPTCEVL